jgi:Putative DNA-binding domain
MLDKRPEDVTLNDIRSLIDTQQREGERIDYKVDLPLPIKSDDRKEFLRDITSFANTYGGYLILGVGEDKDKGIPINIPGLAIDNLDRFKQAIENMIRDSIEPRLFAYTIRDLEVVTGRYVIFIYVPRSWNPPHRLQDDRFYRRNSAGKYILSVEQLRRIFTQGADTLERIRRFVRERVYLINADEGSVPLLPNTPKVILHVLPLASFEGNLTLPIGSNLLSTLREIYPLGEIGSSNLGYNADGLVWSYSTGTRSSSYTQLFRNSIFEGVNSDMANINDNSEQLLNAPYIEEKVCESLSSIFWGLREIEINSPLVISLSIIGVKGYSIPRPPMSHGAVQTFSQDSLFLPEVTLEEFSSFLDQDIDKSTKMIAPKLKLMFDALWQASGYAGSPNYIGEDWKPRS